MLEGPIRSDIEGQAEALRHPLRDRRVWRLSLGSSLLIFTQVALTGFIVLFLESQRGYSHVEAGAALAAINVVGAAGRLGGGRLSDRLGSRVGLIRRIAARDGAHARSCSRPARRVGLALGAGARPRRRALDELERALGRRPRSRPPARAGAAPRSGSSRPCSAWPSP